MDLQEQLQRAFVELGLARPGLGVEPKTTDKAISLARGAIYAAQQALAAPQPSQGAQPVVDQKPASMSDNGSCGSQVSGKPVSAEPDRYKRALEAIIANPGGASAKRIATLALGLDGTEQVSAEAGKGVVHQFRKKHCSDWYDGFPDTEDGGGPYETRTLYVHPSESVAVSAAPMPQPEGETSGCMANEAAYGEAGNPVIDELTDFVVSRWHAEVKNRPLVNKNRRPLDDAWRQILRHLGVDDRARLGPTHDELLEASND